MPGARKSCISVNLRFLWCSARKTVAHSWGFGSIYLSAKSVLILFSKLEFYLDINLRNMEASAFGVSNLFKLRGVMNS